MRRTFFQRVMRAAAPPLFVPFYHAVRPDVPPHLKCLYPPRKPEQFERDIQTFLRYFNPADPADVMAGKPAGKHQLLITFDDGLRSFADYAWPIMKRYEIRPILFVNPAFVDRPELMYRYKASVLVGALEGQTCPDHPIFNGRDGDASKLLQLRYAEREVLDELAAMLGVDWETYLAKERPYLSWAELGTLESEGVYIGGHSMDHPYYHELGAEEQIRQTRDSMAWVQEKLGVAYRLFSFPFTDEGVEASLLAKVPMDASFGTQKIKQESWPRHYQRLCMERTGWSAEQILWAEHAAFQIKRWRGRHRANHGAI